MGFTLSVKDRGILNKLIKQHVREAIGKLSSTTGPTLDEGQVQAPDVYVAKPTTSAGIPAMIPTSGTGSDDFDVPGKATCNIYRLDFSNTDPEIQPAGFTKTVYNLRARPIPQEWVLVTRTKLGPWVALSPPLKAFQMVHGQLTADLLSENGTMVIDNVNTIAGESPVDSVGEGAGNELTVGNPNNSSGSNNSRIDAVYCQEEGGWEALFKC